MWTSLKICSHCVAVVHCLDCTNDFNAWFISYSKKLNRTKLSTSSVKPNVEKKTSQNRYSQRKAKPQILLHTLHYSFSSLPPIYTTSNAFLVEEPCASSSVISFGYQQQPTYLNWCSSYPCPPWSAELPNSVITQNTQNICGVSLVNSFSNLVIC